MRFEAGRKLDALIAERLGWELIPDGHCDECREFGEPIYQTPDGVAPADNWSTSITAAWELVEYLKAKNIHLVLRGEAGDGFSVDFKTYLDWPRGAVVYAEYIVAPTAERAICLAFVEATTNMRQAAEVSPHA